MLPAEGAEQVHQLRAVRAGFGSLFNDKAAPGVSSIIISLGSFLGGIWFDADATGGTMLDICKALPFYYCGFIGFSSPFFACGGSAVVQAVFAADFGCRVFFLFLQGFRDKRRHRDRFLIFVNRDKHQVGAVDQLP